MFEYPGTNTRNVASYLRGDYPAWSPNFLPHLDINDWQRKVSYFTGMRAWKLSWRDLVFDVNFLDAVKLFLHIRLI